MRNNNYKNHFLVLSLITFFSFSVSILVFSPVSFVNIAKALNPADYNKLTGASLGVADWNRLDDDFVIKSGDTMQGPIDMANNQITNLGNPVALTDAVNLSSLNTAVAGSSFVDTSGTPLKAVCGTAAGSWQHYAIATADGVYIDVNTSSAGFLTTPVYFTSISGLAGHWRTTGASSIYSPTSTGFRIYINDLNSEDITPALVNNPISPGWGWVINWCGFGQ